MHYRKLLPVAILAGALIVPAGASAASDSDSIAASASIAQAIEITSFDGTSSLAPAPGSPDTDTVQFAVTANSDWAVSVSGETLENAGSVALSSALQMRAVAGTTFDAEPFGATAALSALDPTGTSADTVSIELKQSVTYADLAGNYSGTVPVSVTNSL